MYFSKTAIEGVWVNRAEKHIDPRGTFEEQFKSSSISDQLGRGFLVAQVNKSVSFQGVVRGIHWTDSPSGQAKYVSCVKGLIWDVYVDLRQESPTFGKWGAEFLSLENGTSLLISEGIGHAFLALETETVVNYLCTAEYKPSDDRTINPLDKALAIPFVQIASEYGISEIILSEKDRAGSAFEEL